MNKASNAHKIELAFHAAEMRKELDAVLEKYNARLVLGWSGKWVKLQAQFNNEPDIGVTILMTSKGKAIRYLTEVEDKLT